MIDEKLITMTRVMVMKFADVQAFLHISSKMLMEHEESIVGVAGKISRHWICQISLSCVARSP